MRDGFVFYDLPNGKVYRLSEVAIQAKKRVRGVNGAPTTVTLAAVPASFRADVSRVDLSSILQAYDAHSQRAG